MRTPIRVAAAAAVAAAAVAAAASPAFASASSPASAGWPRCARRSAWPDGSSPRIWPADAGGVHRPLPPVAVRTAV